MKKHFLTLFALLCFVSIFLSGCKKEEVEQVVVPDTVVEEAENPVEETPVLEEPVIEEELIEEEPVEEEPAEEEPEYPAWYELYDYHAEQPDLAADGEFKNLSVQLGNKPDELYITWFSRSSSKGKVTFHAVEGEGSGSISAKAATEPSVSVPGYYRNSALIEDLESNTTYYYTIKNGNSESAQYKYETQDLYATDFTFTVAGDPEIGLGDEDVWGEHKSIWRVVLNRMKAQIPDSSFLITTGDQVADPKSTVHYDYFLDNSLLYSTALVPVVGNHDNGTGFFGDHFTLPNLDSLGTESGRDGNYWFRKGNALFMVLNTTNIHDFDSHDEFMRNVTRSNPDAKWRIVISHYSPITMVERYQGIREEVKEEFAELGEEFAIDLFIGGHDHIYTRGYFLDEDGDPIVDPADFTNEYHNPGRSVYVIANGSTTALLRDPEPYEWGALSVQNDVPMLSEVRVTEDSIRMITRDADKWNVVDDFTIYKD